MTTEANMGQIEAESVYRRILFCTDFSRNADFAFRMAVASAAIRPSVTLYLLHVIPEPEAQFWKTYLYEVDGIDSKARRDIDEKIDRDYRPLVPEHVEFQVEFRIGNDVQEILRFAQEKRIDLLVLGRQGHSAMPKMFCGRVAEKVVRKAECPVLVIPMGFAERPSGEPHP
jgi:nucleotide-binding universal stress UspA family protein